ncbi:hypothetical protein [Haploplasma axanthum]|uniref:Uncharacterized protein n=1 Tax=Haploplasma axanthum TaxID=29552 RepID=A0A449BDD6_HAPAX|nr:hypothetical protein [Haploplasma axanthum]VEU80456.1 Uncharacterised protein [Haploplasma axanthum]
MKRIKKLILIFITIGVATLIPITKTHASSGTAGTKGFTISNMIYHHDAQAGYLNLDTDDNNYGKINLWSAVYVTRTPENSMIILVLWEAEIESNKTSSAIKRFVNKEMNIVVSSNIPGVVVNSHYPNEDNYVKGKTISWSVESGASSGYMHSVASYSESDFVPEIRLISTTKGSNEVEKTSFLRITIRMIELIKHHIEGITNKKGC